MPAPVTATWSMSAARRGRERPGFPGNKKTPALGRRFVLSFATLRNSVEQRVDIVLRGVAGIAIELRPVQKPGVAFAGIDDRRRMRLDRVDAAPDFHHHVDVVLDELHRGHDLADALTSQVLEIAGLVDRDDAFLDFLGENLL